MKKYNIGIDVGGTKILAAIINDKNEKIVSIKKNTKAYLGLDQTLNRIDIIIQDLLVAAKFDISSIGGIGFGVPGAVDKTSGKVLIAPNLGWKNIDLKDFFQPKYPGVNLHIENDVNAGTFAEYTLTVEKKIKNVVGMFVGTGLGGGIILNGKLYYGTHGFAGEIGHMVINYKGSKCNCGNQGCLEAYASKAGLINQIKASKTKDALILQKYLSENNDVLKSSYLKKLINENNLYITKLAKKMANKLAIGIINLSNLLDLELIILGGGVIDSMHEYLLPQIKKKIEELNVNNIAANLEIRLAQLSDDAVMIGAALLSQIK
ncbi:MAG: ROK family protein [Candidatus Margulisiibacteriota bacterium]|jgi:glucokinase